MLLLNFTARFRLLPSVARNGDGDGLWYLSVRWLGVQATLYSREMGAEAIERFNAMTRVSRPPAALGKTGVR